jgi:hypothetical protein
MAMNDQTKYYYIIEKLSLLGSIRETVHQWNPNFQVQVENGFRIQIEIDKLHEKRGSEPENSEFQEVKTITREIFLKQYRLAINQFFKEEIVEGSFYLMEHSEEFYEIVYFSENKKERKIIVIDFREDIGWVSLTISSVTSKRKSTFIKKAKVITIDRFKNFLQLTRRFLDDSDSVLGTVENYIKNFNKLVSGKDEIGRLITTGERYFASVLEQLKMRKSDIEKHLIEVDTDSNTDRTKLRGELNGIDYAIKIIMENKISPL